MTLIPLFREHLEMERGLSPLTVKGYCDRVMLLGLDDSLGL